MTRYLALVLAVGLCTGPAWGQGLSVQRQAELTELVRNDCGSCHGMTMKGGLGAPLVAQSLQDMDDQALIDTILDGRQGTPMPPWRGMLDEADARFIVRHLKGKTP